MMLIFLMLWRSCLLWCQRSIIEFKIERKQKLRHKERQRCGDWRMQKIIKTCPSISPHNFHFTTVKIFPQQGNVNEWRHLSTSHPLLALRLSLSSLLILLFLYVFDINLYFILSLLLPPLPSSFPLSFFLYLFPISVNMCKSSSSSITFAESQEKSDLTT